MYHKYKVTWLSNTTNGDGLIFGLQQPTGRLKGQVCSLVCKLTGPSSFKRPEWPLALGCAVDDSTINIVQVSALAIMHY